MTMTATLERPAPTLDADQPHLTPTERRLLETLQGHTKRILSRTELVARVLADSMASERTIDVHIRALRRKLGPAAAIRTYRGRGYAWVS